MYNCNAKPILGCGHPSFIPYRIEYLEYGDNRFKLNRTGRYGFVINTHQDGDHDIHLDDGKPPYLVKWIRVRKVEGDEDCSGFKE